MRKVIADRQIQSPPAWEALEGGLFWSDAHLEVHTVMDGDLPVKLQFVSYMYSIKRVVHTLCLLLCGWILREAQQTRY